MRVASVATRVTAPDPWHLPGWRLGVPGAALNPERNRADEPVKARRNAMNTLFFVDSHGGNWATCDADHPDAVAFGPRGCARPALKAEVEGLVELRPRLVDGEQPCHLWPWILVPEGEVGEWDEYEVVPLSDV